MSVAAAQLFRERGFGGIGVADLMKAAGLTDGGFYGHFESKEDLMAQVCEHAWARSKTLFGKGGRDDPRAGCRRSRALERDPRRGPCVDQAVSLPGDIHARSVFAKLAEAGAEIVEQRPHRGQQAALGCIHRMDNVALGGPVGQQMHQLPIADFVVHHQQR